MSELMFDEVPFSWKTYSIHSENFIKGLFGEYRWLSNFTKCDIHFEGLDYTSSENAYQAAKIVPDERIEFTKMSAYDSKKYWRNFTPLYNSRVWDDKKYDIMYVIVFDKFTRNLDLNNKLKDTGNKFIEETNHWDDTFWGVDYKSGKGKNSLGKILMDIRTKI